MPATFSDVTVQAFRDELMKIAAAEKIGVSMKTLKTLGIMGGGAALFEGGRKINRDRSMGRQMRIQQGGY